VGRLDDHRSFAAPVEVASLQVWPILTDDPLEIGEFLTLQEAEAQGLASVRERESGAEVNTLEIENRGERPILVCAGTLVQGGNQDRQIGQDFVVAARSTVPVDAYCVEQGRWDGSSVRFCAAPVIAVSDVRAPAQYGADQAKVWRNVSRVNATLGNGPATDTYFAAVEKVADEEPDAASLAHRGELERKVRERFEELAAGSEEVVGFAYAIAGEPVTVRTFAHERLLLQQLGPFLKAMCLEAELAAREEPAARTKRASVEDVLALVRAAQEAPEEIVETAAANRNAYRKARRAGTSRCILQSLGYAGAVVTEDWTAE
jgi:hypothetical protein